MDKDNGIGDGENGGNSEGEGGSSEGGNGEVISEAVREMEEERRISLLASPLRLQVRALTTSKEREARLKALSGLTPFDLTREENIARNALVLARLNIRRQSTQSPPPSPLRAPSPIHDQPMSFTPPSTPHSASFALSPRPFTPSFALATLPMPMHRDLTSSSHGGPQQETPATPHSSPPPVIAQTAVDRDGWPTWLEEGFDAMAGAEFGPEFHDALIAWTLLERMYNWKTFVSDCVPLSVLLLTLH